MFRLALAVAVSVALHAAALWLLFADRLAPQSDRLYELQLSPGFAVTPNAGGNARTTDGDPASAAKSAGASGSSGALTRNISDLMLSIPYPALARSMNLEGRTLIHCRLTPDGRVLEAHIAETSGHRVLDEAAVRAVRAWRFPVGAPEQLAIPIEFRLQATEDAP